MIFANSPGALLVAPIADEVPHRRIGALNPIWSPDSRVPSTTSGYVAVSFVFTGFVCRSVSLCSAIDVTVVLSACSGDISPQTLNSLLTMSLPEASS